MNNIREKIEHRLGVSLDKIFLFCQRFKIKELAVFGSILRNDFTIDSDIDFLVTLSSEIELKNLVNRDIDIIFKDSLKNSSNWLRKKEILTTAEVIYEA